MANFAMLQIRWDRECAEGVVPAEYSLDKEFAVSLSIDSRVEGGKLRMIAAGEIDLATQPMLMSAIEAAVETTGISGIMIDLGAVTFMDCYGMSALITGRDLAEKRSCEYVIQNANGLPLQLLRLAGVLGHLSGEGPV
jgi:anti-anti-sigma factor